MSQATLCSFTFLCPLPQSPAHRETTAAPSDAADLSISSSGAKSSRMQATRVHNFSSPAVFMVEERSFALAGLLELLVGT